jgi:hypothetical protein
MNKSTSHSIDALPHERKLLAMNHPLRCQCGTLQGHVSHTESVCRGICYCKDCQAYAQFLGKPGEILDEMGGSDVIATLPRHVTFTQGLEALTCVSLSDKGMLRWYASCCNTPVGNTSRDFKVSHVGLLPPGSIGQPGRRLRPGAHAALYEQRQGQSRAQGRQHHSVHSPIHGDADTHQAQWWLQDHPLL